VGHLFQRRFKAILVDRDAHLLEVCRYVELNPVRARSVRKPEAWRWASYRAHVGLAAAPDWLDVDGLHGYVLGRPATSAADHRRAASRYVELVAAAGDAPLWDGALRQQIYLGDAAPGRSPEPSAARDSAFRSGSPVAIVERRRSTGPTPRAG